MADLSLSLGTVGIDAADLLDSYLSLEPFILSDHSEEVWDAISKVKSSTDIVGENIKILRNRIVEVIYVLFWQT